MNMTSWTIQNKRGLDLIGDSHTPDNEPKACVILLHGLKGYKDYGFIPVMAHDLCESGCIVHRFNSSTSGMTNEIETFARPDLFELDTWNRQVEDMRCVIEAIANNKLIGNGLPLFLIGHSRGGGTALLTAGRHHDELSLSGVITINGVNTCCSMEQSRQDEMLKNGFIVSESARTKQALRVSSGWMSEQLDDPEGHDILALAKRIKSAVCVIQGEDDQVVKSEVGIAIANACSTSCHLIPGGDHVLNMRNPSDIASDRSQQLLMVLEIITRFISKHAR